MADYTNGTTEVDAAYVKRAKKMRVWNEEREAWETGATHIAKISGRWYEGKGCLVGMINRADKEPNVKLRGGSGRVCVCVNVVPRGEELRMRYGQGYKIL